MKKRILASIMILIMMLSLIPTTAIAASELAITVDTSAITEGLEPGATFTVPVNISGNNGFTNGDLKVNYDAQKLEFKGFTTSNTIYSKASLKSTNKETGLFSFANFADPDDEENFISCTDNGVFIQLKFSVKNDATAGTTVISISKNPIAAAALKNNNDILNPTFVPGTITVKASTADRTVTFLNGTETVATETVTNGGTLTNIPAAPDAAAGQSFLGWYAVDGADYLLDSVDETISGTEASTETAITADTTYHAIWASSTMLAAGFAPKDGKTEITGISQPSGLQALVGSCNGGTVKLLQDVNLGSTYLTVASGETLTLDLNGKTLSGNGCMDTVQYSGDYGILLNNGTLALISSAETHGRIELTDAGQSMFGYAAIENKGLITRMEKIDVKVETDTLDDNAECGAVAFNSSGDYSDTTSVAVQKIDNCSFSATKASAFTQSYGPLGTIANSTFTGGYWNQEWEGTFAAVVLTNQMVVTEMKNCSIKYNNVDEQSSAEAMYIGFDVTIRSMDDCTITGPNGITITGYSTTNKSTIENLNATITANYGYALTVKKASADIAIAGGTYKGTDDHVFDTSAGTAAITYPAGKTLLKNQDGSWTVQEGYNVYFRNWDGTLLQQVACAKGGNASYTGTVPARATDDDYVYTFADKWNTAEDGSGAEYESTIETVNSDLTLYAQYSTVSARVVTLSYTSGSAGGGGTLLKTGGYSSLKAAMDALNSNNGKYNNVVITLNKDAAETSTVEVKKDVTIDLNGHTLTIDNAENGIVVENGANLTVKDSKGGGIYKHTATSVEKSAILASGSGTVVNVESGTIQAATGNALTVDGAAFHVSGGTISGGQNGICVKTQNASSDCTISGGKILCSGNGYALYMDQSVAPYIKLSGGSFKNTNTQTYLIRTFDNEIKCTFLNGTSLSPSPNTAGFYEVRVVGTYTFVLKADKEHYNAGETVIVTVSAYGSGSINSFGFTPSYDAQKLTFADVRPADTTGSFTVNQETGKSGYTVNGKNGITLGTASTDATKLVTITFTAKENINAETNITLTNLEMAGVGTQGGDKAVVENPLTVTLHDIRVTLTAGNGTINDSTESVILYAKYNAFGLYSDAGRTAAASVSVSAKDGYRLNNKDGESLWKCGNEGYTSFDAIKGLTYTESKSFALQTTKVWTIRFDATGVTGGSLSSTDEITVDDGTKLSAADLPKATPDTGYTFTGWKVGTDSSTVNTNTYEVNSNITLTPVFTAQSFDFTTTANQSTVNVTNGAADNKATYGQNITFTVTPNSGYIVKQVSYTIGSGTAQTITAANGTYTIPGGKIVGDVQLEITTVPYYQITFKAGTGIDLTETTLYTFGDGSGFYTDATFASDKKADVPTPTAQTGYRLADHEGESLWKTENGTGYTAKSVETATFSADTTLTAQSVKTYTVKFASADTAKAAISGMQTVDANSNISNIPTVNYNAGYTFDHWAIGNDTYVSDDALKAVTITADTTVQLIAKDASYSATLNGGDAANVTVITGISDSKATHGTPITFKLTAKDGYKVTKVSYQIGDGEAQEITATDGVYTIPGDMITNTVALVLTTNRTYTITFAAGENGTVAGTTSFVLDAGSKLTQDQLSAVTKTGDAGYTFKEWQIDGVAKTDAEILDTVFTENTTITAIFDHATYSVTATGISGVSGKATHGTDLTFTPAVDGKVVIGITAKIGDTPVNVTKNPDGSYTIAGDVITGDLTITAQTADGSWIFISKDDYKALSADAQIALLTTGKLASGNYLLGNDGMYWSPKYNAYVKIVDANETAATLTAKLSMHTNAQSLTLAYTGDINGDGQATPADGGMINDELHEVNLSYTVTEKMRLEMDFSGDKTVSTVDIMNILRKYVGLG